MPHRLAEPCLFQKNTRFPSVLFSLSSDVTLICSTRIVSTAVLLFFQSQYAAPSFANCTLRIVYPIMYPLAMMSFCYQVEVFRSVSKHNSRPLILSGLFDAVIAVLTQIYLDAGPVSLHRTAFRLPDGLLNWHLCYSGCTRIYRF